MLNNLKKANKTPKLTFWESANRPMFVKSVWMEDEGYRHFFLNSNECMKKRNDFRASRKAQTMQNDSFERISKEIADLDLAKAETTRTLNKSSDLQVTVESSHLKNPKHLSRQQTVESEHYNPEPDNSREQLDQVKPEESGKIQLTERVLQWLDLAGKQTLIHNEITREKCEQSAVLRRVQTTESLMSMTSVKTLKPSLSFASKLPPPPRIARIRRVATTESLMQTSSLRFVRPSLRRSESLHHLSITFDNKSLEKPPEPSEEKCQSPGIRFDLFPTTLRCSKKFLSCVHSRTLLTRSHSDASNYSESNESTATSTATIEDFSKRKRYPKHLLRKSSTLEQRYKSIINRHILETTCNEQSAKRQLHIFLPKSTNNRNQLAAGGANECDSCLSTIISDISKS